MEPKTLILMELHVTFDPDISTVQKDGERVSNCGGLCVRATLEEDKLHKDIRLRISDSTARSRHDLDQNKTTIVKFCTPLVCKDTKKSDSRIETLDQAVTRSNEEIRDIDDSEEANLSSAIVMNLPNSNIKDHGLGSSEILESRIAVKKLCCCNSDDTSGYNTSEAPQILAPKNLTQSENIGNNVTLEKLQRLLAESNLRDAVVRNKCEKSENSARNDDDDFPNESGGKFAFPVLVDYREATITAADLTRPEFVRMLTEIKEQTRDVEKQLSRMNNAMRSANLNETISDIAHLENDRKTMKKEEDNATENTENALISSSKIEIEDNNKKTKKKKKSNASSQIDVSQDDKSEKSKKLRLKSPEHDKNDKKPTSEETKFPAAFSQGEDDDQTKIAKSRTNHNAEDNLRVSTNRIFIVQSKDSKSTQMNLGQESTFVDPSETVNECIMVRPSRIHKFKKQCSGESTIIVRGTCIEDPKNFACRNKRSVSLESSRSPMRLGSLPLSKSTKSMIPKLQENKERRKSMSTQSSETRVEVSTSLDDFNPRAPPSTPINADSSSERRPSRYSFKTLVARTSSKNRKSSTNDKSRSPSVDSKRNVSVHDTIVFRTSNDNNVTSEDKGKHVRTEIMGIERTRTTPKPFTIKSTRKSTKLSDSMKLEKSESTYEDASTSFHQTPRDSRTSDSSKSTKFEKPMGRLLERRTPGMEYLKDDNPRENERRKASISTVKYDSKEELSLTNYPANSNRLERVVTAKPGKIVDEKLSNISNDKRSKVHHRSRSDPRESTREKSSR